MFNKFMNEAIITAQQSGEDIPTGAVVVKDGEIISKTCNKREKNKDIIAHAEILALQDAARIIGDWRLKDCEIYVTLEPCPMCAWALLQARVSKIYFGSFDIKYGALGSAIDLRNFSDSKPLVYSGIMEEECDILINNFWERKRS